MSTASHRSRLSLRDFSAVAPRPYRQLRDRAPVDPHERRLYRKRKRPHRLADDEPFAPLLYTRQQTSRILSTSIATLRRLEDEGLLTPKRLSRKLTAKVHYTADEVHALAEGGDDA